MSAVTDLGRPQRPQVITFLVTLAPPLVYVAWIWMSLKSLPIYPGLIVPLVLLVCVGGASFILNGLRRTGFRRRIMKLRAEHAAKARDEAGTRDLREKIGSTLTTLTMIGSVSFAMVIFALPLPFLSDEAYEQLVIRRPVFVDEATLTSMARPTFVFLVMILVFTSVVLLVAIDAYDTARDPVLPPDQIEALRVFSRGSYYVGLLNLVYTVLLACLVMQPMASMLTGVGFLIAVVLYDQSGGPGRAARRSP